MEEQNVPTQILEDSLSTVDSGANSSAEAEAGFSLENFASDILAQEGIIEQSEEATQSDESDEVLEEDNELSEDTDIDTPDEADDYVETDDSDHEYDIVSFDDFKGHALEIGGEYYTGAQLKSMLGRMKSAGNEAQQATQTKQELEAQKAELAKREQWLEQRQAASVQSDQLVQMQVRANEIKEAIETARQQGDMYEVALQKDQLEVLSEKYKAVQQEVQQVRQQEQSQKLENVSKVVTERGYKYLLEDTPQAKAWTDYVVSKVGQNGLQDVISSADTIEAFEKARKYDAAASKKGKKLKSSGKTLQSGNGVNLNAKKAQEVQAKRNAARKGQLSAEDASAEIDRIAASFFSGS